MKDKDTLYLIAFITLMFTAILVVAADVVIPAVTSDPVLAYVQAAGFPAWAGVLIWGVMRLTNELRDISVKLDAHVVQTEKRLASLEAAIFYRTMPNKDERGL